MWWHVESKGRKNGNEERNKHAGRPLTYTDKHECLYPGIGRVSTIQREGYSTVDVPESDLCYLPSQV